jgi:hypothetical protein
MEPGYQRSRQSPEDPSAPSQKLTLEPGAAAETSDHEVADRNERSWLQVRISARIAVVIAERPSDQAALLNADGLPALVYLRVIT